MADITRAMGEALPLDMRIKYQDMGDGTYALVQAMSWEAGEQSLASLVEDVRHLIMSEGTIWHVATDGNDSNSGESPDEALATIGRAITLASPGDAISVGTGTWDEDGLDLDKEGLQLWCQHSTTLLNSAGTVLTLSADYALAKGVRTAQAGQVGFHVTGARCELDDCRARGGASVGFDVDGGSAGLRDCFAGQPAVGFDLSGNGVKLYDCHTIGVDGATRGYYVSGVRGLFVRCTSNGHGTAGYETVVGADDHVFYFCTSGAGDGDRVDGGEHNSWPGLVDRRRREQHEHIYPFGAGEGVANDPVTVNNTTTDDAAGNRQDQNYWGDVVRIVPPDVLTLMWYSVGVYVYATTANDIQQWQVFYTDDIYSTAQDGGNDWDHLETALTVADGSIIQANDLVWITGGDRPDGEIMEVTNVMGNVVTVASETRASGGTGLRYDYDLGGGGQMMYVVRRAGIRMLHGFDGDFSAAGNREFARLNWHAPKLVVPNGAMIMRMLNATDGGASTFDVRAIYED